MSHNDPALWAEYDAIARAAEELRIRGANLAAQPGYPVDLKVKAGLLAYHLRQSHNEARALAGDRPEGMKAGV